MNESHGGTKEVGLSEELSTQPVLDVAQIQALTKMALKIESYYGIAQDIEWAFFEGKFYLLQISPITT